jgi:hypothetical protein
MYSKKINFFLNNHYLYLLVLFILWYWFLGQKFINEPFIWDDLHLIRTYSIDELISVWSGSWDPDGLETPSFRPIATLLYHTQGTIFGENVQIQKIFVFLLFYLLFILIVKLLSKLNFDKIEIFLISTLLIFSKIFTTLTSWMTMSHLIFCYILLFLCLINYLNWLEKNRIINIFFAFLFGIGSILTREEVYYIPALIFLTGLYFSEFTKKNIIKIFFTSLFFFILVVIHYYLRGIFIEGAPQIAFGGFRSFLSHLLQSGITSGWFSFMTKITVLQFAWLSLIFFVSLILLINITKISVIDKKKIFILLLISLATSTPSLVASRAFGIFIPSIFSLALIVKIFFIYKNNSKSFFYKSFLSKISNIIIILLIIFGITGGYIRSDEHLKAMNKYSIYIVAYDTEVIFKKIHVEKSSVPEIRKKQKKLFLKNLGITEYISLDKIKEKIYKNEISNKIYIPNFHPLSPNFYPLLLLKERAI